MLDVDFEDIEAAGGSGSRGEEAFSIGTAAAAIAALSAVALRRGKEEKPAAIDDDGVTGKGLRAEISKHSHACDSDRRLTGACPIRSAFTLLKLFYLVLLLHILAVVGAGQ